MVYIFLAMICYSLALTFAAFASRAADPIVVAAITNTISALIPILIIIPTIGKMSVQNQRMGMIMAVCGGLLIALFVILLNKAFVQNKVAIVSPIVFGGSIFLSAILSYFFLKEKISMFQGIGMGLILFGIIFITYARLTGK